MQNWLVEIGLKDWEPDLKSGTRVVTYEEVQATNEFHARHIGFEQFLARLKTDSELQKLMETNHLTPKKCCAAVAITDLK